MGYEDTKFSITAICEIFINDFTSIIDLSWDINQNIPVFNECISKIFNSSEKSFDHILLADIFNKISKDENGNSWHEKLIDISLKIIKEVILENSPLIQNTQAF